MEQYNCKNCGAPIKHSYNHRCEYCGTIVDFNEPEDNTLEIHPYDLVDIKYIDTVRDHLTNRIIIRFSGYKVEKPKIYEQADDLYVSKVVSCINPPRVFFQVEFSIFDLEKYGIEFLEHRLFSLISPSERKNVQRQLLENHRDFLTYKI